MKGYILLFFIISLLFPVQAMAYIDPGSGSAIMSAIIGFLVAVLLAVKTYWYKLKTIFTRKSSSENKGNADLNE